MSRVAVINVVGLTRRHLGAATPQISGWLRRKQAVPIEPLLPAVTCPMQSAFLTGLPPAKSGIVGNGWYDRTLDEVHFWKQSNHLVSGAKLWEKIRLEHPDFTTAKIFWWYNMYSSAEFSITPRPIYRADGSKIFDIYTHPPSVRAEIKAALGEFPFPQFWGPMAGPASTRWIAGSAKWIEEKFWPNLSLVYLPHLDYDFQRFGPDSAQAAKALQEIDEVVGDLIGFFKHRAVKPVIVSEYGITAVDHPVHINRVFRENGWIALRDEMGTEVFDPGASRVFAVADHQVAHIYVKDRALLPEVKEVLGVTEGVEQILDGMWRSLAELEHVRAGDLIAVADARSWFTYYWWLDDERAPDYARTVDIHRKPGYDPAELFFDPAIKKLKRTLGLRLLRKKLGFRVLMDVIPLDATLVRGSHGRIPEDSLDWPILAGDFPGLDGTVKISAIQVHQELLGAIRRGIAS
ncbi:MAG: alkaline phosphatase family protein [Verrucomicrobiales bacterium]